MPYRYLTCPSCGLPLEKRIFGGPPPEVAEKGVPAGFWIRLAALIIDDLIVFAVGAALWPALFGETFWIITRQASAHASSFHINLRGWTYLMWLSYTVFFLATWGATPGKMALNIRVVDENGSSKIGFIRAAIRAAVAFVSWILFIGYLIALARRDRRTLHDLAAGTYPIRPVASQTVATDPSDSWGG